MRRILTALMAFLLALTALSAPEIWAAPTLQWLTVPDEDEVSYSLVYGNNRFAKLIPPTHDNRAVAFSDDGVNWTLSQLPEPWGPSWVIFGNGRFGALAQNLASQSAWFWSADGETWEGPGILHSPPVYYAEVAYGNGLYVMNTGATSTDGLTWTPSSRPFPGGITDVTFGNGLFVLSGREHDPVTRSFFDQYGTIYTSSDGRQWQRYDLGPKLSGAKVVACNGRFVSTNPSGGVVLSLDGAEWIPVATGHTMRGLSCTENRFVASSPGLIHTSGDGYMWSTISAVSDWSFNRASFGSDGRLLTMDANKILASDPVCLPFLDLAATDLACASVTRLVNERIIAGFPDGLFHPAETLTRSQVAKMLVVTMGWEPAPDRPLPFSDTAGNWAATEGYLQAAVASGVINGYPDGTFGPNQPVSRSELVKIVAAAAGLVPSGQPVYTDIYPNDWYVGWLAAAAQADLVGAAAATPLWTDAEFGHDQQATRAEAAIILSNLVASRGE